MTRAISHPPHQPLTVPDRGMHHGRAHVFEPEDLDALNFALAAQRPLLLRGEPGTGKSQIAEAAAAALGCPMVARTIDARTESRDLLYEIDFVLRLAEAQLEGAIHGADLDALREKLSLPHFTRPGPLWWAFDWRSADALKLKARPPVPTTNWQPGQGCVVLLDEIDKAEADLPNGLLEALGHGCFSDPAGNEIATRGEPPLVIVTSNDERELPDAFVRRCLVHTLRLPAERDAFVEFVAVRGAAHFPQLEDAVRRDAAGMLWDDRQACTSARPGLAEYLDVLRVLGKQGKKQQRDALERVRRYSFAKFAAPSAGQAPSES